MCNFSCTSHILITKFEASKTLNKNLKIEFILMPFFLISLYIFTSSKFSLIEISFFDLIKGSYIAFFKIKFKKKIVKKIYFFITSIY